MKRHLDRRGFVALVGATLAIDPERLMWTPGAKCISVPAPLSNLMITSRYDHVLDCYRFQIAAGTGAVYGGDFAGLRHKHEAIQVLADNVGVSPRWLIRRIDLA